jgi:hypothetical protein
LEAKPGNTALSAQENDVHAKSQRPKGKKEPIAWQQLGGNSRIDFFY